MKRYIKSVTTHKQHFIIWFREGDDDEDYTVIPAANIKEAKEKAANMFGGDVLSVKFYEP